MFMRSRCSRCSIAAGVPGVPDVPVFQEFKVVQIFNSSSLFVICIFQLHYRFFYSNIAPYASSAENKTPSSIEPAELSYVIVAFLLYM